MSPSGGEDKIFKAIKAWKNVNWYQAETRIFSLQKRIFAASENFDHLKSTRQPTSKARSKLLSLQRMLVTHPYAKLIAVKHVSEQTRENKTTDLNKIANYAEQRMISIQSTSNALQLLASSMTSNKYAKLKGGDNNPPIEELP